MRGQDCLCLNTLFLLLLLNMCPNFLPPYFKRYYTRGTTKLNNFGQIIIKEERGRENKEKEICLWTFWYLYF